jgi:hypothetical protein
MGSLKASIPTKCIDHMPKPKKHAEATDQINRSFLKSEREVREAKIKLSKAAETAISMESATKKGS